MKFRVRSLDPYFIVGMFAVVLAGGTVEWLRRRSDPHPFKYMPVAIEDAYRRAGIARVLGSTNAGVVVSELTDPECPACATADSELWPGLLRQIRGGHVRLVVYDVLGHPHSANAITAAECVRQTGDSTYWLFRELALRHQNTWSHDFDPTAVLAGLADSVGADSAQVERCVRQRGALVKNVLDSLTRLAVASGMQGTPTFAINGRVVSWDSVKSLTRQ